MSRAAASMEASAPNRISILNPKPQDRILPLIIPRVWRRPRRTGTAPAIRCCTDGLMSGCSTRFGLLGTASPPARSTRPTGSGLGATGVASSGSETTINRKLYDISLTVCKKAGPNTERLQDSGFEAILRDLALGLRFQGSEGTTTRASLLG